MTNITKDIVNDIRAEIAAKITAGSTLFANGAIYAYPKSTLAGYPAVMVMPSENEADYSSTSDDKLTFGFKLHVFYQMQAETEQETAEEAIGECVGDLLRIFSAKNVLSTVDWVHPVPSIWGELQVGEAVYRTAEITLRCVKFVTT